LGDTKLDAQVCNPKGKPLRLHSPEQADQLKRLLSAGVFWAAKSVQGKQPTPAPAILTLPVLMAEASRELGLKPVRTLHLLDLLYTMGWINHPATNPLADQTPAAVGHIVAQYGRPYLGHILPTREGIGPTDVARLPESVPGDGAALYGLIWRRFVAAHMAPAVDRVFTAAVQVGASQDKRYPVVLRLTASLPFFEGWRRVFMGEIPAGTPPVLPSLTHGQTLEAAQISLSERTTPPLDESAALALLSAFGMDIPTAADTLTTLRAADLLSDTPEVRLTDAGKNWAAFLADHFGALTDPTAAAERAADLDRIAAEEVTCSEVLTAFWSRFGQSLRPAKPAAPRKRKPLLLHPITETNR
jgi:DNA topoisomerase-1